MLYYRRKVEERGSLWTRAQQRNDGRMRKAEEVVARRRAVAEAMASAGGVSFHNVEALAEELGVTTKTIWSDRRAVLDIWATENDLPMPVRLAEFLARIDSVADKAEREGAFSPAVSALALRAKVTGIEAPTRSEVQHSGAVSIAGLTDAQAQALAAALVDEG